ncbi:MAG: response regulator transcription factor, partial [Caldilineaceae bacterium]|nr:response regulator transcription factor [Caldilineaceae bacterium]
ELFTTAQRRGRPNPVLLAVFGLYLDGATVKEIAQTLQRAPSSIRNYITLIYQIFELEADDYPSLQVRRSHLVELARIRGLTPSATI